MAGIEVIVPAEQENKRRKGCGMQAKANNWKFVCEGSTEAQKDQLIVDIHELGKKWVGKKIKFVFQAEIGPTTGYEHFQGAIGFGKKDCPKKVTIKNMWERLCVTPFPRYFEPSANKGTGKGQHFKFEDYEMKLDSRREEPWAGPHDSREEKEAVYVPYQYKIDKLFVWQEQIDASKHERHPRWIDVIVDPDGSKGKSTIAAIGHLRGGFRVPPLADHQVIIQTVCDVMMGRHERDPKILFIDLARSWDQKKLDAILIAIEEIKNGFLFDVRYHYKEWVIDAPRIWIFMNREPDLKGLTANRWRLWKIKDNDSPLERFESEQTQE